MQDPQEMEWISGMQETFFVIFLAGLGLWAVAEFFRTFWEPKTKDFDAENDVNLKLLSK